MDKCPKQRTDENRGDLEDRILEKSTEETMVEDFAVAAVELMKQSSQGNDTCMCADTVMGGCNVSISDFECTLDSENQQLPEQYPSPERMVIMNEREIDGYKFVKPIGCGGLAAVFEVEKKGKSYAMKVPLAPGNVAKKQLENEIDTLVMLRWGINSKLKSKEWIKEPNIVQMHDYKKGDLTYAVLQLLDNSFKAKSDFYMGDVVSSISSVNSAVSSVGQQPVRVALFIYDILHAIELMHELGYVHRDIKYQNCLDTKKQGKLHAVLYDMGSALNLNDEEHISQANLILSPFYVSKYLARTVLRHHRKKGGFFKNCFNGRLKTVLKTGDYHALAHSAAELLLGVPPYHLNGVSTSSASNLFELEKVNTVTGALKAIANYKSDPINKKKIKELPMGDMFLQVFDMLLDTEITRPGKVDEIYDVLKKEIPQQGLFIKYKA